MAKYTREQIEGKLTKVFDSTLQTKTIEVSSDTEVTPDEGYLALKEVKVKVLTEGGGSTSTADDVLWFNDVYIDYPEFNISKGTVQTVSWKDGSVETQPITYAPLYTLTDKLTGSKLYGDTQLDIIPSNLQPVKPDFIEHTTGTLKGVMLTGIQLEGEVENINNSTISKFRGTLGIGLLNWAFSYVLYINDEDTYLHIKYPEEEYYFTRITKLIASNGNELIVPEQPEEE